MARVHDDSYDEATEARSPTTVTATLVYSMLVGPNYHRDDCEDV
jgi:hypothetical protein